MSTICVMLSNNITTYCYRAFCGHHVNVMVTWDFSNNQAYVCYINGVIVAVESQFEV